MEVEWRLTGSGIRTERDAQNIRNAISEKPFAKTRPRPGVRQPISGIRKIFPFVLEKNERPNRVGSN